MGDRRDADEIGDIPMKTSTPEEIVKAALAKGELEKLLLGAPAYQYRSKYSPAPGNTDLTELLSVVYRDLAADERGLAAEILLAALNKIVHTYEGLRPVASCILYEAGSQADRRPPLGLPLSELARALDASIQRYSDPLRADKTGEGYEWPDGRLGEFRRLSRNTVSLGGPSFCE